MRVVRRFSLPDVDSKVGNNGVMPFPRVSNAAATAENADLDPEVAGKIYLIGDYAVEITYLCHSGKFILLGAELPPWELLNSLSKELRHRLV
jgi:inositol-1,3,4-trisphosphate 5/6-kinase/inositol-tetrakisphosphate 1-kinase